MRDKMDDRYGEVFYEGDFINKFYYQDGTLMYEGDIENSRPYGKGKWYSKNGTLMYEGDFENGAKHGQGRLYDKDGTIFYEGGFQDDLRHGKGKFYYHSGSVFYEGDFRNDVPHGKGIMYSRSGTVVFRGQMADGVKNGKGKLYSENGTLMYEGEFEGNVRHGTGTQYYENGKRYYEGAFLYDGIPWKGKLYDQNRKLIPGMECPQSAGEFYYEDGSTLLDSSTIDDMFAVANQESREHGTSSGDMGFEGEKRYWLNDPKDPLYDETDPIQEMFRKEARRRRFRTTYEEIYVQLEILSEESSSSVEKGDILESFCAVLLDEMGYTNIKISGGANDGGIDLEAIKQDYFGVTKIIAQCKNYFGAVVGADDVMKLIGSVAHFEADVGFLFTTGTFTRQALSIQDRRIELFDGSVLKELSRTHLNRMNIEEILDKAQSFKN